MNDLTLYSKPKFSVRIFLDKVFSKKESDPTIIDVTPLKPKRKIDYLFPLAKYIQRLARFFHDLGFILEFLTLVSGVMGSMFSLMARTMTRDDIHYTIFKLIGFAVWDFVLYSVLMTLAIYACWELLQVWKWLKRWAMNYVPQESKKNFR